MALQDINYRLVLADLIARRDRLNASINTIREILGESPQVQTTGVVLPNLATTASALDLQTAGSPPPLPYARMTIKDACVAALRLAGGKQKTRTIADSIKVGGVSSQSSDPYRSVYNALDNESKKDGGKVIKVENEWDLRNRNS